MECQMDMPEYMGVSCIGGTPKSSIFMGFSTVIHPFWGTPIYGDPHVSDRMPEDMPDRMTDRMPEDMPDRMPEGMPDSMPDRMSNRMPDRMSDGMN